MNSTAFYILAAVMVASSLWAVSARNILHAAIALITAFFGTAILYLGLQSEFLAVAQVLVYIGGVVIFVVFTILLTSRLGEAAMMPKPVRVLAGLALSIGLLASFVVILQRAGNWVAGPFPLSSPGYGSLAAIGRKFLQMGPEGMLVPFEIVSVLLLSAMVGAIAIARKEEE